MDNIRVRLGGFRGAYGDTREVRHQADRFQCRDGASDYHRADILVDNGVYSRLSVGDRQHFRKVVGIFDIVGVGDGGFVVVLF